MLSFQLPLPGQPGGPPNLPPSYTVHITATKPEQVGTVSTGGPTWVTSSGFRLQDFLSTLYSMPAERIEFNDPGLADRRLDVALRLPAEESEKSMHQRIAQALEVQLGIKIEVFTRTEDVYTISVADSKKLASPKAAVGGGFTSTSTEFRTTPGETNGLSQHELAQLMQAKLEDQRTQNGIALDSIDLDGPVDQLCRVLETGVQRPVLDRTGYEGDLRISIRRNGVDRDRFFEKIKADYGLAVTPAKAEVQHLVVSSEAPKHQYR